MFNGTLKNMLRWMCSERPKDWDRYIGSLLLTYGEVKQESLGYAPFAFCTAEQSENCLQVSQLSQR